MAAGTFHPVCAHDKKQQLPAPHRITAVFYVSQDAAQCFSRAASQPALFNGGLCAHTCVFHLL